MFCGLCRSKNSKHRKQNKQDASTDSDAYHEVGESNVDCDQNADLYDVVDDNKTTTAERKQRKRSLLKEGEVEQDLYDPVGENNRVAVKEYNSDGSDDASDTEMVCNVAYEPFEVGALKLSTTDEQDVYDSMEDGDDKNGGPNVGSSTSFAKKANIRKIAQTMPRMAPDMSQLAFSAASKGKELLSRRRTSPGSINRNKRNALSSVDQTSINDSLQSINTSIINADDLSDVFRPLTPKEVDDDSVSTRSRNAEVDLKSAKEDHTSNIPSTSKATNEDISHDATGDDEPTTDAQNMLKDKPDVCSRKLSVRSSNIQTETEVYESGIDNTIDDVTDRIPGETPNYPREYDDEEENSENTQLRNTNKAEDATKTGECVINNTLGEKETDCDYSAVYGNVAHEPCSEVDSIKLSTVSPGQFVFFTAQSFCRVEEDVVLHETLSKRQEKYAPISRVNSREVRRFSL